MNSYIRSFSSTFVNSVMETGINKYMSDYKKQFNSFGALLTKSGFGFKKHQFEGVQWCVKNEMRTDSLVSNGTVVRGGIIADEMGLGKTILMIGTMFLNQLKKTLIVVPPILIDQWHNEIYKSTGHKALIYYGKNKQSVGLAELSKACIVLTSYNTLLPLKSKKTKKVLVNHLFDIKWDRAIFDEAHHLRNMKTTRFLCCKKIDTRIRWLVSGTPIQNRRSDFYSLCNILGFKPEIYKNVLNVSHIVSNYVLKRSKADAGILLPPVCIENIVVPWKSQNEKLLSEEIHSLIPNQSGVSYTKGSSVAEMIWSTNDQKAIMLIAMLRARQSCVLPALMKAPIKRCVIEDESGKYLDALEYSSKLDAVVKLIIERKDNEKGKIVFCHYIDEIDMIAKRLLEGGLKKVVTYDGRNSGSTAKLCQAADAIILQIQTGCEGLNLQKYFSEIYFVSPHWNPAIEDQAIARCHRIGQEKEVNVFRFEMDGFDKMPEQDLKPINLEKYVTKVQGAKRDIAYSTLQQN